MQTSRTTVPQSLEDVFREDILPALPHTAISLLSLSKDERSGPPQYARVIEADPGLMGQVLRFVNSAYFGFSREIVSIQHALTLVGTRAVTNFALWNAVFSVIPNPKFGPFDLKTLWLDSLRRAVFARELGKRLRLPDAEDLFAGALLQDMAIPMLLKELPEQYEDLVRRRTAEGRRLSGLETELFGWNHADAAALLAKRWRLPESFVALISHHIRLDELLTKGDSHRNCACVALASHLPSCCDDQWSEQTAFLAGFVTLMNRTSPDAADELADLCAFVDEATAEFAPTMKLPAPKASLVSML